MKAEHIVLLDMREVVNFTDYFVIASATSDRMLDALGNAIQRGIKTEYSKTCISEGPAMSGWILLDYGDVVVHLFSEELRDYYHLEDLWQDSKTLLNLQ